LKKQLFKKILTGFLAHQCMGRLAGKRASWFDGTNASFPIFMVCYFIDLKTEMQIITFFHFVAT